MRALTHDSDSLEGINAKRLRELVSVSDEFPFHIGVKALILPRPVATCTRTQYVTDDVLPALVEGDDMVKIQLYSVERRVLTAHIASVAVTQLEDPFIQGFRVSCGLPVPCSTPTFRRAILLLRILVVEVFLTRMAGATFLHRRGIRCLAPFPYV